jgi:glycosyltransferase involved in cell wall biosynthesis
MSTPVVSVVIPARNAARTLGLTLGDALAQTLQSIEVIVVDDGSNDETADIVRAAAFQDQRVSLIRGPHRGLPAARNAGIAAARGRFIAPLDADDLWHPTKLERQVAVLEEAGASAGLVYCGFRDIDKHGRVIRTPPPYFYNGKVLNRHLYYNFVGNGSSPLFRRDILDVVGPYDESMVRGCEDYDFQLRIAAGFRFVYVRDYLVGYRRGDGGMSGDYERMLAEELTLAKKVARSRPEVQSFTARLKEAEVLLGLSRRRLKDGQVRGGLRAAAHAVTGYPSATATAMVRMFTGPAELMIRLARPDPTVGRYFHDVDPTEYTRRRFHSRSLLMSVIGDR